MQVQVFKHQVYPGTNQVHCGDILHFGEQNGSFFVWAKSSSAWSKTVVLVMTGEMFDDTYLMHLGTVMTNNGSFVVHAFI